MSAVCSFYSIMAFGKIQIGDIKEVIQEKKATVGVAILYQDKIFTLSDNQQYPLMSLFKFHVTVAALKKMDREHIPLDSTVYITREQMHENTYSPLRNKYPNQGIHISLRDIITYTIIYSDNNTCDWLIDFAGGIKKVDTFIKSLGIKKLNLTETEHSMHENIMNSYNNWSSPLSVVQLIKKIYTDEILSATSFAFLEETMLNCSSGENKLKAGLPPNVKIGHKTGHSDRTSDGLQISETDAGVIYLPDGERCYIAVLIKNSLESDETNARIMADITRVIYHSLQK